MASSTTTFAFALKARYSEKKVENLTEADSPLYSMIEKVGMSGESMVVPLIAANPQGLSQALTTAQTAAAGAGGNVQGFKFILTPGDYTGSVTIGDKVIKASKDNPGAFLRNQTAEIDGLYTQFGATLATYLYSNGGNSLGRRSSAAATVITLTDPYDAMNFEVGMYLQFSTDDGSGAVAPKAGTSRVTAVDRAAGTVTVDAQIGTAADNDYIFRSGDYLGNTGNTIFYGLRAYLAATTAPGALYSMTRTSDPVRLAGAYVPTADLTGLSIEERIQKLGAYMTGRYKGPGADRAYMNPEDWQDLAISLQSKGIRPLQDAEAKFNFEALSVVLGGKTVKIYADRYCPKGTFFALQMKNWSFYYLGPSLIHTFNEDGLEMVRGATTKDYEYRLVSYPVPVCNAPGFSGRVSLL
jgi:hypothetical protein